MDSSESEKYLCKIPAEDGSTYYLLTHTHGGGFHLSMSNGDLAWTGSLSEDDLDTLCKKIKMDFDTFLEESKKALTRRSMGRLHCLYQVKKTASTLRFTWKKHVPSEDIKFTLGSIDMKQSANPSLVTMEIFDHCIEGGTDLGQQITSLQSDNERLSAERANALKRLDKCVSAKEELEKDLYGKFVTILNTKKEKIRDMLEEMAADPTPAIDDSDAEPTSSRGATGKRTRKPSPTPREKERQTDSEYDTDEDVKPANPVSQPSKKMKKEVHDEEEDSLLLDNGSPEQAPITARRRRRGGVDKKTTPAKPVIPKRTSTPGTTGTDRGRRSSMRKTISNTSSDNIDPDDLLQDL